MLYHTRDLLQESCGNLTRSTIPLLVYPHRTLLAEVALEPGEVGNIYREVAVEVCAVVVLGVAHRSAETGPQNSEVADIYVVTVIGITRAHEAHLHLYCAAS